MSGLRAAGVWGSGAVGGLGTLAGGAGLATAVVVNKTVLKDSDSLDHRERVARRAGRLGTYAGAGLGTAGGLTAVSALGSVAGLSGAGVMSGLAAIGGAVGLGAGAGTVLVVA